MLNIVTNNQSKLWILQNTSGQFQFQSYNNGDFFNSEGFSSHGDFWPLKPPGDVVSWGFSNFLIIFLKMVRNSSKEFYGEIAVI